MTNATSIAQALPCQRRVAVQWVTAGILLPGWASGAQAQVALSGAINHAGRFRALSQRMAKAYCQQHLMVLPAATHCTATRRWQGSACAIDVAFVMSYP